MVKPLLKRLIAGVLFLFLSTTLFATDYYWVGGTGSWTDLTHWATTSGGSVKHTVLPGQADNVFFDANSFTAADQVVTITDGAICRDMNWTGVTNNPEIYSFFDDISIYGSLILPASVKRNFLGSVRFKATSGAHIINLANLPLSTPNNETIYMEGAGGTWTLADGLTINGVSVTAGTFNTNGFTLNCSILGTTGTTTRSISLGSSQINCPTWNVANATGLTLNAGTSTITSSFRLTGGGLTYNNLVVDGTTEIRNNNTFNNITLNEGSVVKLTAGTTQTLATLTSNGTAVDPVTIQSTTTGSAATLAKSGGGAVTISYAKIQDNTATGGTFTANNSTNLGNVTGWNIPVDEPTTSATGLTFSAVTSNAITLNWTSGNGASRIIVAKATSAVANNPTDGTVYIAATNFGGSSPFFTSGQSVVYNGTGSTTTVTGLLPNTTYHFAIFEYNGTTSPNYRTTSTTGSRVTGTATLATQPTASASNVTFTNKTANSMTLSWTNGNGARRIVIASPGTSTAPTSINDGSDYTAGTYGSGTMVDGRGYVVYNGTGNSFTVSGLSAESAYSFAIIEYNGTGTTANYFTPGFAAGSAATLKAAPTTPSSDIIVTGSTASTINITWTAGNGESRIVIVRQGAAVNAAPQDGVYYTYTTNFATTTDLGGGNKVMYVGSGTSIFLGGLSPLTTYHIAIFDFNGADAAKVNYLTTPATVSATTINPEPTLAASGHTEDNITFTSFTSHWTNGNGARRLVAIKDAVTGLNASVTDGTSYEANAVFGQGAELATDFYVVYDGTGSEVTVTGLLPGRNYYIYIWEYNGTGTSANYLTNITIGAAQTLKYKPTVQATELTVTATTSNSATLTWKRGNGSHTMLVARAGAPVSALIKDSTAIASYNNNSGTVYGEGHDLGNGNIVVYNGTSTAVPVTATITNLTPGTTYHFAVFEFNQTSYNYFLTSAAPTANTTTTQAGASYYWVGGSGNWTDFANHWATSSGGNVFHNKVPGSADNVYFDANSFFEDNQTVTVDVNNIACKDMDWSAITKKVSFAGTNCSMNLSVFGSLKLSGNLNPNIATIRFKATAPGNVIDMAGKSKFSSSCPGSVYVDGYQGEWTLNGNLDVYGFYFYHGTLRAENSNLSFYSIGSFYAEASKALYLGNSTLRTNTWETHSNLTVTGGTVIFDNTSSNFLFSVNGATFQKVIIKSAAASYTGRILGGGTIENLELGSGTKAFFESGKTFKLGSLTAAGDTLKTTIIGATIPGKATTFHKATGAININYVQLRDNNATGGAQFNATNAANGGNVTGWNITNPPVIHLPKIAATGIEFPRVFARELKMKWVNGDGTGRIVIAKENAPVDRYPENGKTYPASDIFGSGGDIGNGNYVVYRGVMDTLTVKGLTPGKKYHFAVYEYNAWDILIKYKMRPAATGNTVTPGASDIIISNNPVTVCNVKYFDDGGNGLYTPRKSFTQTLTPETPGSKLGVVFSSFETNASDTLYIHDGATTSAPVLGKFAYQKRPTGPIIAQNAAGVLTFRLNALSGSATGFPGWQAELFCAGTPATEPTIQASALTVSEQTGNSLRVRLSKGNGGRRVIVARADNAVSRTPVDGTDFTASTTFGDGTLLGEGNYIVYSGDGDDITVSGLKQNTTYHFSAFEYNGTVGAANYLTANPATGSGTTLFTTPTEASYNLSFSYVTRTSMELSFGNGNGSNRLVVMRKGAPVSFVPVDGTSYEVNKDLGNDTKVVSNGSNSFYINVYGLTQLTEYHFAIFEFNGTDTRTKYLTTSFLTGKQSTRGPVFYLGKLNDSYCPNSTISASWDLWDGSFASGNKFSLQLSDETGKFDNPVVLKDTITVAGEGTIIARIPNTVKGGTGYKLRIVSSNPVSVSDSIRTIAIPVVTDVTFTVADSTFVSSSAINNQWLRNGAPIPGATQQSFKYEDGGRYTVRVTENGCYKDAPEFVVTANEEAVFGSTVRVYPNPVKTTLLVESPGGSDGNYVVRDIHGKAVATGSLTRSKDQVDVSALTPGVYLIRVSRDGRSVTKVFIKE